MGCAWRGATARHAGEAWSATGGGGEPMPGGMEPGRRRLRGRGGGAARMRSARRVVVVALGGGRGADSPREREARSGIRHAGGRYPCQRIAHSKRVGAACLRGALWRAFPASRTRRGRWGLCRGMGRGAARSAGQSGALGIGGRGEISFGAGLPPPSVRRFLAVVRICRGCRAYNVRI